MVSWLLLLLLLFLYCLFIYDCLFFRQSVSVFLSKISLFSWVLDFFFPSHLLVQFQLNLVGFSILVLPDSLELDCFSVF